MALQFAWHWRASVKTLRWVLVVLVVLGGLVGVSRFLTTRPGQLDPFSDEGGLESSLQSQVENPSRDVPGRDLNTVPRYPRSVRTFYGREQMRGGEAFLVMYRCQGTLHAVSSFYEIELPKYGWMLAVKDENFLHIDFIRRDAKEFGPPMVQLQFSLLSDGETMVSIVAINDE